MGRGPARIAVTSQSLIQSDLVRGQQRPCFKMRRQMHGPQAPLQIADRGCLPRDTGACGVSLGECLVERTFLGDQRLPDRFGGGVHAIANEVDPARLIGGQSKLPRQRPHVGWAGVGVQLGGFRHAHALAVTQGGDVLVRERLDGAGLRTDVLGWLCAGGEDGRGQKPDGQSRDQRFGAAWVTFPVWGKDTTAVTIPAKDFGRSGSQRRPKAGAASPETFAARAQDAGRLATTEITLGER